jgi:UDP-N-acetylmuramate dehydrogenase
MKELREEPLARQAYWRVGGPAERFVVVETVAELRELGPVALVLGAGSNLLPPDAGLRGTVARLGGELRELEVRDGVVRIGAGLPNIVALGRLERAGLGGLGCLAGVPGTLGGAVAMNAGTALGEVEAVLVAVEGLLAGELVRLERAELPMAYREGGLPPGYIVTQVELRVQEDVDGAERARIEHHLARRRATQPLDLPSCGSVFRNPPGDHAGRLIEAVGLKGHRVGAAQISDKHANFIVNLGGASASDVMGCIRAAWDTVRRETGVTLTPEVHVVGDWDPSIWPLVSPG